MKKWNMVIDLARCHDCNNCFMADKDEFWENDWSPTAAPQPRLGQRWIRILNKERGQHPRVQSVYLPLLCQHCDAPACVTADGAVYKRDDGLVIIDPEKAKGRREIVDSCPYGVVCWNEEAQLPQKCTGCAHLIDAGWTETRCSHVCPTGALRLVLADDEEMRELVQSEGLSAYQSEHGTRPRVLFKNLHRWTSAFIAGNVAFADTDENAEGIGVTVEADGRKLGEAVTNNYGDFLVDGLEPGLDYSLRLEVAGYRPDARDVRVDESVSLETIFLEKA